MEAAIMKPIHLANHNISIQVSLVPAIAALCLGLLNTANAEPVIFASQLSGPAGVTTDSGGNVYVHSDAITTTVLTKFLPDATPVAQVSLGGINVSEFVGSRLTRVPDTDSMLLLSPQGVIYTFTPDLQIGPLIDLRPLVGQTVSGVYDILTQQFRDLFLGVGPDWGDIAAYRDNAVILNLFVTATTGAAGGFPFVLRIGYDTSSGAITTQRVVLTSSGTTAGAVNQPPGLAVNFEGNVLTTMPFPVSVDPLGGFSESLVYFTAEFPENPASVIPQFILGDPQTRSGIADFASFGMTTDAAGHFYVAAGVVGSSVCGVQGSGPLVFIDRTLTQFLCFPLGGPIVPSTDVAVSPVDNFAFMTFFGYPGLVVRFDPIVPTQ
jgi:hypothetical protein